VGVWVFVGVTVKVRVGGSGVLVGGSVAEGLVVAVGGKGAFAPQANRKYALVNNMIFSQNR
jgi:hypothetical protein